MTPEEIEAVERTLAKVDGRLEQVAAAFYARLFAAHPDVEALFVSDRQQQQAKFARQLDVIVRAIRDLPSFLARGAELGSRHRGYGVRSQHYAMALEPLLASLAEALGDEWSAETDRAWRRAYALVAEGMLQGATLEPQR